MQTSLYFIIHEFHIIILKLVWYLVFLKLQFSTVMELVELIFESVSIGQNVKVEPRSNLTCQTFENVNWIDVTILILKQRCDHIVYVINTDTYYIVDVINTLSNWDRASDRYYGTFGVANRTVEVAVFINMTALLLHEIYPFASHVQFTIQKLRRRRGYMARERLIL